MTATLGNTDFHYALGADGRLYARWTQAEDGSCHYGVVTEMNGATPIIGGRDVEPNDLARAWVPEGLALARLGPAFASLSQLWRANR